MNEFLLKDSIPHLKSLLAVSYLFEYEDKTLAFYSVSNDKISVADCDSNRKFKNAFQNIMPRGKQYRSYPAVKIGRFGVDKVYQGTGYGSQILDYIKGNFIINNKTGCQYITVDAYKQSLDFYSKNGFRFLTSKDQGKDTRQMYYNLTDYIGI